MPLRLPRPGRKDTVTPAGTGWSSEPRAFSPRRCCQPSPEQVLSAGVTTGSTAARAWTTRTFVVTGRGFAAGFGAAGEAGRAAVLAFGGTGVAKVMSIGWGATRSTATTCAWGAAAAGVTGADPWRVSAAAAPASRVVSAPAPIHV